MLDKKKITEELERWEREVQERKPMGDGVEIYVDKEEVKRRIPAEKVERLKDVVRYRFSLEDPKDVASRVFSGILLNGAYREFLRGFLCTLYLAGKIGDEELKRGLKDDGELKNILHEKGKEVEEFYRIFDLLDGMDFEVDGIPFVFRQVAGGCGLFLACALREVVDYLDRVHKGENPSESFLVSAYLVDFLCSITGWEFRKMRRFKIEEGRE
ncbi:hypothetical protein DRQ16_02955 [bacterium]|nr:MAG: hypothetical protein DRQ16_02955 [bacterium]